MRTATIERTDWLMRLLTMQTPEVKINLINRLSASLLNTKKQKKGTDISFFNGLSNAWDDGVSPEDETDSIRSALTSGVTRTLAEF